MKSKDYYRERYEFYKKLLEKEENPKLRELMGLYCKSYENKDGEYMLINDEIIKKED